jgi:hypothetical protein
MQKLCIVIGQGSYIMEEADMSILSGSGRRAALPPGQHSEQI